MIQDRTHPGGDRIAVIGGGLGGLTACCTLAARGYRVALYEYNPWLGGKAAVLEDAGYRFDMGPTILTMPRTLKRVFDEAGRDMTDYLDLVRLDPQWRCFFEDQRVLDLYEDVDRMAGRLREFGCDERSIAGYRDFAAYAKRQESISERFFFWRSVGGIGDVFDFGNSLNLSTLSDVLSMRMGRSVADTIRKHVPDERVAQMLDHYTQYVGSSPFLAPSVLAGIADIQSAQGVWYPMGGTRAVPEALTKLAGELGVELHTGVGVTRIATDHGRVVGVELSDGERHSVAAVVSNMDSVRTNRELLDAPISQRFLKRRPYEPACSGVVLYLGLKQRYDHLAHHCFVFSRDAEEEFDAIYRQGEPAPDPTAYLGCPSHTEPGVAPEGGEAMYVLVHTPYLRPHHDWRTDGERFGKYRQTILDKLKRTAGLEDIEDRIEVEHALTPHDIHERYRVLDGAIYGLASHGTVRGAFKPANRSPDVKGLYYAGGSAHPGPGMPMVMMSGWIAADSIDTDGLVERTEAPRASQQNEASAPAARQPEPV